MKEEIYNILKLVLNDEIRYEFKISNSDLEIICDWTDCKKEVRYIRVHNGIHMIYYEYSIQPPEKLIKFTNKIFNFICENFKGEFREEIINEILKRT